MLQPKFLVISVQGCLVGAEAVDRSKPSQAQYPSLGAAFGGIELSGAPPNLNKNFLHDFFGLRSLLNDLYTQTEYTRGKRVIQCGKRCFIAARCIGQQLVAID